MVAVLWNRPSQKEDLIAASLSKTRSSGNASSLIERYSTGSNVWLLSPREVQKFARAKPTQTQTGNLTRLLVWRQNEICQIFDATLDFFWISLLSN